ncbi:hypothetical protein GQ55_8G183900 [Panicum hallii var. hallii]|uniref:Uncharacterized protein n=1 Tax=Panicum hallii var. hallii TaxID=1504633 RepID=A0A2T7CNT7_9POAL|nr:hypothetical protein GQ55_8G183900 [Panicum hallii var. hallii]
MDGRQQEEVQLHRRGGAPVRGVQGEPPLIRQEKRRQQHRRAPPNPPRPQRLR